MLVSHASKLAITALVDLAARDANQWISADELCQSIKTDLPFLRQIMNRLAGEGIVHSRKGQWGGFQIAVPSDQLFLSRVVSAIEGAQLSTRCLLNPESCDGAVPCSLAATGHTIRKMLLDFLNRETIQAVAERGIERMDRLDLDVLDRE